MQRRTRDALHATKQAASLTRRLLSFSRKQVLRPSLIDIGGVTSRLGDLLRPSLGEAYDLQISVPEGAWDIWADASHLESALLNLIINARDAQPRGGVIELEAANTTLTETQARELDLEGAEDLFVSAGPRDFVMLTVRDEGEGMNEEVRSRALDPFFTTKEVGKGSGLGLSMVYGFVRQSSGLLALKSVAGVGTEVTVLFPRVTSPESIGTDQE